MCGVVLDEISGNLPSDAFDVTDFITELDAVKLVRMLEQLGTERGGNKLCAGRQLVDHVGHRFTMLRVQSLIDFVEQVERGGVAFLNREYQPQRHQRLLTAR